MIGNEPKDKLAIYRMYLRKSVMESDFHSELTEKLSKTPDEWLLTTEELFATLVVKMPNWEDVLRPNTTIDPDEIIRFLKIILERQFQKLAQILGCSDKDSQQLGQEAAASQHTALDQFINHS